MKVYLLLSGLSICSEGLFAVKAYLLLSIALCLGHCGILYVYLGASFSFIASSQSSFHRFDFVA